MLRTIFKNHGSYVFQEKGMWFLFLNFGVFRFGLATNEQVFLKYHVSSILDRVFTLILVSGCHGL